VTFLHLSSIPEIEAVVAQVIALVLLIIGGVRLILDAWEPIFQKARRRSKDHTKWPIEGPSP
jgi:hypothetical protein